MLTKVKVAGFKPGKSGNPAGRLRDKSIDEAIDDFLTQRTSQGARDIVRLLVSRLKRYDAPARWLMECAIANLPSEAIRTWQVKAHQFEIDRIRRDAEYDSPYSPAPRPE